MTIFQTRLSLLLSIFLFLVWGAPLASASNRFLTYQGRITELNGSPLEYEFTQFKFEITNPAGTCVLYRETSNTIDMRNSQGVFDVAIGSGSVDPATPAGNNIESVFRNDTTFNCITSGTYSAADGQNRKLRVSFRDSVGWRLLTSDQEIRGVPFASFAQSAASANRLGTASEADFLKISNIPTCTAGTFLRHVAPTGTLVCEAVGSVSGASISGNISGSAAGFTGSLAGDVTGTQAATSVDRVKGLPVNTAAAADGKVLKYQSGSLVFADDDAGMATIADGSVTTAKLATGAVTSDRIADSAVTDSKISSITTAGKVSGSAITSGTISGSTAINTSGLIQTNNGIRLFTGSNYVELKASGSPSGDYSLRFPPAAGSNGQVLKVDASGNLYWANDDAGGGGAPTGAAGGDLTGTYPNPGVAAIRGNAVSSGAIPGADVGKVYRWNGSELAPAYLNFGDLRTTGGAQQLTAACAANEKIQWSVITDAFTCQTIGSLDASAITTGTIDTARLPASVNYWQPATVGIHYAGAKVGVGTSTPEGTLHLSQAAPAIAFTSTAGPVNFKHNLLYPMNGGLMFERVFDINWATRVPVFKFTSDSQLHLGSHIGTPTDDIAFSSYGLAQRTIGVARNDSGLNSFHGSDLTIRSGGGGAGRTDKNSGKLILTTGVSTGAGTSEIQFWTAQAGASGAVDNSVTQRMTINGQGNVGIGVTSPTSKLEVAGVIHSTTGGIKFPDGTTQTTAATGGGSGTVTTVSSANSYITVADGSTTPSITANVGTSANTLAAGDDSRFTDSRTPTGSAGGDLSGTYPNPGVAAIRGNAVATGNIPGADIGKVYRWNGTALTPTFLNFGDLRTAGGAQQLAAVCAANEKIQWSVITDTFTCQSIGSLNASAITAGTIDAARLPASVKYWDAATGGINYAGGNVGIGTTTPSEKLDVIGKIKASELCISSDCRSSWPAATGDFLANGSVPMTGSLKITPGSAISPSLIFNGDSNTGLFQPVADSVAISANSTERFRIDSIGNAIINPASGFVLGSPADLTNSLVYGNTGLATCFNSTCNTRSGILSFVGSRIQVSYPIGGTAGSAATPSYASGVDTDTGIFFPGTNQFAIATGGTEQVRVIASGNVGIGTTNPEAKLEVNGSFKSGNSWAKATPANTTITSSGTLSSFSFTCNGGPILIFGNLSVANTAGSWNSIVAYIREGSPTGTVIRSISGTSNNGPTVGLFSTTVQTLHNCSAGAKTFYLTLDTNPGVTIQAQNIEFSAAELGIKSP